MSETLKLARGLSALVRDAVEHSSRAVETLQKEIAGRPFAILEAIPLVAVPAKSVHVVHDAVVTLTHASIRAVNGVAGAAVGAALDLAGNLAAETVDAVAEPAARQEEPRARTAEPQEEPRARTAEPQEPPSEPSAT